MLMPAGTPVKNKQKIFHMQLHAKSHNYFLLIFILLQTTKSTNLTDNQLPSEEDKDMASASQTQVCWIDQDFTFIDLTQFQSIFYVPT